jgi:uncharacterized protein YgbK (DUF1537 family)
MSALLGCIADDYTGATDLAGTLVREGMRCVQMVGVPHRDPAEVDSEAIVIALKSRSIAAAEAVEQSLAALRWLQAAGCRQFYFKYCSTFDSTDHGNIGPVAEALLDALGSDFTIACPAFPRNGRTVYNGYLFVGDVLLNESGMQDHPLTPMTDPNLVRVLSRQARGDVGLVPLKQVRAGVQEVAAAFQSLQSQGTRLAITDATDDEDLRNIGAACRDLSLVTGGSGLAIGLPETYRKVGLLGPAAQADRLPHVEGSSALISGSCSRATQEQVRIASQQLPSYPIDPLALAGDANIASQAVTWARPRLAEGPILIYSTSAPAAVLEAQQRLGADRAGALVEQALSRIARELVDIGVRRLVVAGGETAGAVVRELGVEGLRIGQEIDPGVPWTVALGEPPLALALKSGNFGSPDFFLKAFEVLP